MTLQVENLGKSFGEKQAISNISFTVQPGQVFGLLGLNGAGKSTTIRIILDIMEADEGTVSWHGKPAQGVPRAVFGYLPEERGLYPNMKVTEQLVLFGQLQGLTKPNALTQTQTWLQRFGITHYSTKTISDLSKGNQQKIQFIAAILHGPKLLVLDEPFSGLDPVNTDLFKSVFRELVELGTAILFSSHQLDYVEELSDAVGIIHESKLVLSGDIEDIISAEQPTEIRVRAPEEMVRAVVPAAIQEELRVDKRGRWILVPAASVNPVQLLSSLVAKGAMVSHFEVVRPSLHDIFLRKVGKS